MFSHFKKIASQSSIYSLSNILNKAFGILLMPFYTRLLTQSEFGIISLLTPTIAFFSTLYAFGGKATWNRFYYDAPQNSPQQKQTLGSVFLIQMLIGLILLALSLFVFQDFITSLLPGIAFTPFIAITLLTAFFLNLFELKLFLLRNQQKAIQFGILSVLKFLLTISLTIVLVGGFKMGALGKVYSEGILALLFGLGLTISLSKDIKFNISKTALKKYFDYALPILPHTLSTVSIVIFGRLILNKENGLEDTGVYNVAFLIASAMNLLVLSINQSWGPYFMKSATSGKEDTQTIFRRLTTIYFVGISTIGLALILFSKEMVELLTTKSYFGAQFVLPILIFGYFFLGAYYINSSKILYKKSFAGYMSMITLTSTLINLGLNLYLVKPLGIYGPAISMCATYFIQFAMTFQLGQKAFHISYQYTKIGAVFLMFILFALSYLILPDSLHILVLILIKLSIIVAFLVSFYVLNVISKEDIANATARVKKLRK